MSTVPVIQDKFDGFFYTPGGVGGGVPTEYNKLVFVNGKWNEQSTVQAGNKSSSANNTPGANKMNAPGILPAVLAFAAVCMLFRSKK